MSDQDVREAALQVTAKALAGRLPREGPVTVRDIADKLTGRDQWSPRLDGRTRAGKAWHEAAWQASCALADFEATGLVVRFITRREVLWMTMQDAEFTADQMAREIGEARSRQKEPSEDP